MPLTCGTVRGTCHPQRLGIIVDLYLAVLIAEKVHNWFDRTMEMPQLDKASWRKMEDGFWMVVGRHPIVASIQSLITKVSRILIARQGFVGSEIIVASIPQSHDERVALTLSDCGARFQNSKDALIVMKGAGQRLDPLDLQMLVSIFFFVSKRFDGTS